MSTNNQDPFLDQVSQLASSVSEVANEAKSLHQDVSAIKDRTTQDKKIVVTLLLVLGMMLALTLVNLHTLNSINDCTVPGGKCAQREALTTQAILGETAHRNEIERLTTEIQVAQAKGDAVAVQARQIRLEEERATLAQYDRALALINSGRMVQLPNEPGDNGQNS